MKRFALILSIAFLAFGMLSCSGSSEKKTTETNKVEVTEVAKVLVYYFHGKQRCRTCVAIQNVSQEAITEAFAENPDVKFVEIDFSERTNAALADKYEIAFSSLVVATSTEHINLTDFAFSNVMSNPDDLKETIVAEVNNFLNK